MSKCLTKPPSLFLTLSSVGNINRPGWLILIKHWVYVDTFPYDFCESSTFQMITWPKYTGSRDQTVQGCNYCTCTWLSVDIQDPSFAFSQHLLFFCTTHNYSDSQNHTHLTPSKTTVKKNSQTKTVTFSSDPISGGQSRGRGRPSTKASNKTELQTQNTRNAPVTASNDGLMVSSWLQHRYIWDGRGGYHPFDTCNRTVSTKTHKWGLLWMF